MVHGVHVAPSRSALAVATYAHACDIDAGPALGVNVKFVRGFHMFTCTEVWPYGCTVVVILCILVPAGAWKVFAGSTPAPDTHSCTMHRMCHRVTGE
jgi:hypothetical protein